MSSVGGLTLYPIDYRTALASSLIPPPPPHQRPLRSAFPRGETTGLLRSPPRSFRVEVVPIGRWCIIRDGGIRSPHAWPRTFWSKPDSIFGLSLDHGLYQHFTWVDLSRTAGPRPPRCWQSPCRLALPRPIRGSRLRCPPGSVPHRCRRRPLG